MIKSPFSNSSSLDGVVFKKINKCNLPNNKQKLHGHLIICRKDLRQNLIFFHDKSPI